MLTKKTALSGVFMGTGETRVWGKCHVHSTLGRGVRGPRQAHLHVRYFPRNFWSRNGHSRNDSREHLRMNPVSMQQCSTNTQPEENTTGDKEDQDIPLLKEVIIWEGLKDEETEPVVQRKQWHMRFKGSSALWWRIRDGLMDENTWTWALQGVWAFKRLGWWWWWYQPRCKGKPRQAY